VHDGKRSRNEEASLLLVETSTRGLISQKTQLCEPDLLDKMHRLSQENKIFQVNNDVTN
jgi:hypothetical protein